MDWSSTELWGSVGACIAAVIIGIRKVLAKRKDSQERRAITPVQKSAEVFRDQHTIMKRVVLTTSAMRVISLVAKNGGTPWPPDKALYVSCIDQSNAPDVPNTWKRWRNWECDPAYRTLLHDLINSDERGIIVFTRNMHGRLAEHYLDQGVVASVVFKVIYIAADNSLIFYSMNFGRQGVTEDEMGEYERQARAFYNKPDSVASLVAELREVWGRLYN